MGDRKEVVEESISSELLIDIQNISYAYPIEMGNKGERQSIPVLQNMSLQVQEGTYVAVLGHNGSGKSTLARHCNALLLPDTGRVLVTGLDTRDISQQRMIRDQVGMIFQHPDNQIIATVVEDDVAWGLAIRGFPVAVIRERVTEALETVGIAHLRGIAPHKLSGGQRQRVAIAGVLALRPRCIVADEATAALDPLTRQEITELLYKLNQSYGITILHVTHLLEEVLQADRVLVIEHGKIVEDSDPGTIFADIERLRALKLAIPEPLLLAERLRQAGMLIAPDAITIEAIAREIVR